MFKMFIDVLCKKSFVGHFRWGRMELGEAGAPAAALVFVLEAQLMLAGRGDARTGERRVAPAAQVVAACIPVGGRGGPAGR